MNVRGFLLVNLFIQFGSFVYTSIAQTNSIQSQIISQELNTPKVCNNYNHLSITPVMIADCLLINNSSCQFHRLEQPKNVEILRMHYLWTNHTANLFSNLSKTEQSIVKPFEIWPLIDAPACNKFGKPTKQLSRDPEVKTKLVSDKSHWAVWEGFNNRTNPGCRDILVVFQYNSIPSHPDAGRLVIQHAQTMKEDIMYFGYCFKSSGIPKFLKGRRFRKFHPKVTGLAPHCLHAYAVTNQGVLKILSNVEPCGSTVDNQIANLANEGIITFKFINITYDTDEFKSQCAKYGVHLGDDQQDGIFLQGALDVDVPKFVDGTAAHDLSRDQSVYILFNKTWRYIPTVEMFNKLLGNSEKGAVKVLTSWQRRCHYPDGPDLTASEVPEISAIRMRNIYNITK